MNFTMMHGSTNINIRVSYNNNTKNIQLKFILTINIKLYLYINCIPIIIQLDIRHSTNRNMLQKDNNI